MQIVSAFTDYYDSTAARMDHDSTPVYRRYPTIFAVGLGPRVGKSSSGGNDARRFPWIEPLRPLEQIWNSFPYVPHFFNSRLVVFCGRVVPVYRSELRVGDAGPVYHDPAHLLEAANGGRLAEQFHAAELERFNDSSCPTHLRRMNADSVRTWQRRIDADIPKPKAKNERRIEIDTDWPGRRRSLSRKSVDHWDSVPKTVPDSVHLHVGAPIFLVRPGRESEGNGTVIERNPQLLDFDFARVVDPFQAWQELDRYLGTVLASQVDPPLTTGGDAIVRDAKGFDSMSFKNGPGQGKKARREARRKSEGETV